MTTLMPIGHHRPERRGAALLLVLIALAVGLLLVATWLGGRQESVPIAQRIAAGAGARQAAASGADLAVATLDAEPDWRAACDAGRFDTEFTMADAICSLRVVDADTGDRPTDTTSTIHVTCTATVDGVAATIERTVDVEVAESMVDLGFGETAIVVEHELRIRDDAALLPWTARPGIPEGPMVVGSIDGRDDAVVIEDAAITLGTEVLLVDERSIPGSNGGWRVLPDPLPQIARPFVPSPDLDEAAPDRSPVELSSPPVTDVLSDRVRMPARTDLQIDEDRVIRSLTDIELADGAVISVTAGTLVLDAAQDLIIRGATISVADGAGLILRAGRELRLHDAVIVPETISPSEAGTEFHVDTLARDAMLATLDGANASITIEGRSAVVLSVVAPGAGVAVRDDAVLHGRIVASNVELAGRAVVYARPDDGRVIGLTTPIGPHRDDDGRLFDELAEGDLGAAADRIGIPVVFLTEVAEPDPEVIARRAEEIRGKMRRSLEERRRRRGGPRWAWGSRDHDE